MGGLISLEHVINHMFVHEKDHGCVSHLFNQTLQDIVESFTLLDCTVVRFSLHTG